MCDRGQESWFHPGLQRHVAQNAYGLKPQKARLVKTNKNKNPNKTLVGVGLEGERRGGREVGGGRLQVVETGI